MIYKLFTQNTKQLALLIDPDKHTAQSLRSIAKSAQKLGVDYIFVGGSLLTTDISECVNAIKKVFLGPVILFPGHATQVTQYADAILFLSLISGRNPEFLIGNHVIAAPAIKQAGLEVIPTGYILIESGKTTSVEYMSNTKPIPRSKPDIAIATAMAGEMLGLRALYIEAGSGADESVDVELIQKIKQTCTIPIIVGGGIQTTQQLQDIYTAGADIAVIGTVIEQQPELLASMVACMQAM
ncbi:MAG TPA: geranylgeranylglyceryl/heptaprenylglyceryl phosphate synthase [Bacteroidales bacterium]|nr:geranylgeranylglyceryl/heptaprenylglyceryl phosphate synthase [Bacteroidales bacterium]